MMKKKFMDRAIKLAHLAMEQNQGGPFGCVIVKNDSIIAEGANSVTSQNDPTAHAEIVAIRNACQTLGDFQLTDCEIYTSCEPCPMCLGAIYWSRPSKIYFAASRQDAADAGFDDHFIYNELNRSPQDRKIPMISIERNQAIQVFDRWRNKEDKIKY